MGVPRPIRQWIEKERSTKTRSMMFLGVLASVFTFMPAQMKARYGYGAGIVIQDVSDLYQPLASFGNWVLVPQYEWRWYPASFDSDWRPYANSCRSTPRPSPEFPARSAHED
jgi:hypothetical protein